jgi:hypothetical protein
VCEGYSAQLPSVNSFEEAEFIAAFNPRRTLWIGGHDKNTEGTWEWLDGNVWASPVLVENGRTLWGRNQPDANHFNDG